MSAAPNGDGEVGKVVVTEIVNEADGVLSFRLRRASGELFPAWQPGAHLALDLPNGLVRQYSLCGNLDDRESLTIAILREPESRGGSAYLHDHVEVGTTIGACEVRNNFELVEASEYVFVAGGIGLTPLIPMIQQAEASDVPWRLLYGGRSRSSMAFLGLLEAFGERVLVRPQDECGLLDFHAEATGGMHEGGVAYACGPEPMLAALQSHCEERSIPLHIERFHASVESLCGSGENTGFQCELRRTGRTVAVGPDESIIQALERERIFTRSDCREGTCGSCETAVLVGAVEHRDVLLSADERAESKTMMICVSRATSPTLVLDL